jgi:hypothetical protein
MSISLGLQDAIGYEDFRLTSLRTSWILPLSAASTRSLSSRRTLANAWFLFIALCSISKEKENHISERHGKHTLLDDHAELVHIHNLCHWIGNASTAYRQSIWILAMNKRQVEHAHG